VDRKADRTQGKEGGRLPDCPGMVQMATNPEAKTVEVLHLESGTYRLVGRWHPGERARSRLLKGFEVPVAPLLGEQ
jgi:hypothetical protein